MNAHNFLSTTALQGAKTTGAVLAVMAAKAGQSIANLSGGVDHFINNQSLRLKTLMENCSGGSALDEPSLVHNFMCLIKPKLSSSFSLADETLSALCAMLNLFSNGKYVAMPKEIYQNEKTNANIALMSGVGASTAINTGIDVGVPFAKAANNTMRTMLTPQQMSSEVAAQTTAASGAVGVGLAVSSVQIGIHTLKFFQTKLGTLKPDFTNIVTAIANIQNKIAQNELYEYDGNDNELKIKLDKLETLLQKFINVHNLKSGNITSVIELTRTVQPLLSFVKVEEIDDSLISRIDRDLDAIIERRRESAMQTSVENPASTVRKTFRDTGNMFANTFRDTVNTVKKAIEERNGIRGGKTKRRIRKNTNKKHKVNKKRHSRK
jgi:hypothetical protein